MRYADPMATCRHLLCELVEGSAAISTPDDVVPTCSLEIQRARGCRPGQFAKDIAPALFEEVRTLLGAIDIDDRTEATKTSAARLAQIVRLEALV